VLKEINSTKRIKTRRKYNSGDTSFYGFSPFGVKRQSSERVGGVS
jgi:hypothetical protein